MYAQTSMIPRVLLADDHALMMEGLQSLLTGHVQVVGTAADGRELVEAAIQLKPDIVILDISMPGLNGIEAARQLRKFVPHTKLILLTMYADALYVTEAKRLGVSAYVLKRSAASELLMAIEAVQRGHTYITPLLMQGEAEPFLLRGEPTTGSPLTSRQREVLQLVAEGKSAKEIAVELKLSFKTAQFHKANVMRRLGLRTTADLVKYAVRHGMTGS
jgi:DNA-binding NarL/FixJ family response regulator